MSSINLFNALCWVNQCTFPADLEADLVTLGAPADIAKDISFAFARSDRNIMRFYEEYAYATKDIAWQKYLTDYLSHHIAQYQPSTSAAPAASNAGKEETPSLAVPAFSPPMLIQVPSASKSYGFGFVDTTDLSSLRLYRDHLESILNSLPSEPLVTAQKYQQDIALLTSFAEETRSQTPE